MARIQGILLLLLSFGYIVLELYDRQWVEDGTNLLLIGVLLFALPTMRGVFLLICAALLLLGVVLLAAQDAAPHAWLDGLRINLSLIAVLVFSQLLGIPVKTGDYIRSLQVVFERKMNEPYFLFASSKILTHLLGFVLNIGSMAIVHQLSLASRVRSDRLRAAGIGRGYGSVTFWSPYFGTMALILHQLPVQWSDIAGHLLALVLISFAVSHAAEWNVLKRVRREHAECERDQGREREHAEASSGTDNPRYRHAVRKVVELFAMLIIMVVFVLAVVHETGIDMVLGVCLFSIGFPLAWCACSGKWKAYTRNVRDHVFGRLPSMKKEIVLFILAGFVGGALRQTEFGPALTELIADTFGSFRTGIALALLLMVVLLAVIGFHPMIPVTILVTNIESDLIGFSTEAFAVLMLVSVGLANIISPASALSNLLASLLKVNVSEVTVKWNLKFVSLMLLVVPVYIGVIRL
jgi:hypothetical protein